MEYPVTQQTGIGGTDLPAAALSLAGHYQLGWHLTSYRPKRLGLVRFSGLLLFALGSLALLGVAVISLVPLGILISLGFVGMFGYFLVMSPNVNRAVAARRVHVFERGFIVMKSPAQLVAVRWDVVAWVLQEITDRYVNGIHVATTYLYTVVLPDGGKVKLTHFYDGIAELGQTIAREVTREHLPRAIEAVQAGRTVTFGDLQVSLAGLTSGRHGLLPWTQVEEIQVVQGYLKLRRAGKWLAWSSKPVKQIPNLFVFLNLADRLHRAHQA
jgi:hypothetical protein